MERRRKETFYDECLFLAEMLYYIFECKLTANLRLQPLGFHMYPYILQVCVCLYVYMYLNLHIYLRAKFGYTLCKEQKDGPESKE